MEWKWELARKLKSARNGQKDQIIQGYMTMTGRSKQTLYRIARAHGYRPERKKRCDKGKPKCGLARGQIEHVGALIHATSRDNKGGIMPVARALEITVEKGVIDPRTVSISSMQRILREREINKAAFREPTPHTGMRSLHPNHVHLVDVSVCIQYYLKGGRMRIMSEKEFYKNKLEKLAKIKTRLLRYLLVDHFSGAYHLKYYDTTGETANNLFDFLCESWRKKPDPRLPFHGVPFLILQDAGSANLSKPMGGFYRGLDIKLPPGKPHNARRQGGVEAMHNVIENWFESGLKIQPATSMTQLNEWALDFMVKHQALHIHTRHKMTRSSCWLLIKPEMLRELPADDIVRDLYARPEEERTVDGTRSIPFRSNTYRLRHIEGVRPGSKVMVILRPYHWPEVAVRFNDVEYLVKPTEILPAEMGGFKADDAVIGLEFKAQPETETQRAAKRMENIAYGEDRKRNSTPFAGTIVMGNQAEKVGNLTPMPRRGTPIETGRDLVAKEISITEFLKRLRGEIGRVSPELNRELREVYGGSVPVKESERVIGAIAAGQEWRIAHSAESIA